MQNAHFFSIFENIFQIWTCSIDHRLRFGGWNRIDGIIVFLRSILHQSLCGSILRYWRMQFLPTINYNTAISGQKSRIQSRFLGDWGQTTLLMIHLRHLPFDILIIYSAELFSFHSKYKYAQFLIKFSLWAIPLLCKRIKRISKNENKFKY